jgi:chemotaxis protein methyltransferase CheR
LLEQIIPEHGVMEGYEVEHEFPAVGHRTMYLNARQVVYKAGAENTIRGDHNWRYKPIAQLRLIAE